MTTQIYNERKVLLVMGRQDDGLAADVAIAYQGLGVEVDRVISDVAAADYLNQSCGPVDVCWLGQNMDPVREIIRTRIASKDAYIGAISRNGVNADIKLSDAGTLAELATEDPEALRRMYQQSERVQQARAEEAYI